MGQISLAVILIYFLLKNIDIGKTIELLGGASHLVLIITFLNVISVNYTRGIIICHLASVHTRLKWNYMFLVNMIGAFFTNFMPSQVGGDIVKSVYMFPFFNRKGNAVAVLVSQRLLGFSATLFVGIVSGAILLPGGQKIVILTYGGAIVFTGAILWAGYLWGKGWIFPTTKKMVSILPGAIQRALHGFSETIRLYGGRKKVLINAFLMSIGSSLHSSTCYWMAGLALGADISFEKAIFICCFSMLTVLIPLTPGGIGIGEGATVISCVLLGISKEIALAMALTLRLYQILSSIFGGLIYLVVKAPQKELGGALSENENPPG